MLTLKAIALAVQVSLVVAAVPTVKLDSGTFVGKNIGRVSEFLGIPFAQPPVGDLRFRLPQPLGVYNGSYTVTSYGPSCPQQALNLPLPDGLPAQAVDFIVNTIYGVVFPDDEDCLTLNVIKPASAAPDSRLPVVVWIFGGGFELGSTTTYDGGLVVERSIQLGQPIVYVSMNYRLSGFGFMPGREIKDAGVGNLGLHDQRQAFRWVQKYISKFGGDPSKVTIWGESAGAISASLHMLTNGGDTEGLFRASVMQSGSPIPVGSIEHGQKYYDAVVAQTGCSGAADTLACLRTIPYPQLKNAINKSPGIFAYQSLNLAWLPRVDGVFLRDNPQQLVLQGSVANIPFITGDCDDEGTLFSLSTLNITSTAELKTYIKQVFLPGISDDELDKIADFYPEDITAGSPFSTGILNALTPQFKRIAAFQGDGVFQGPRRFFLDHTSGRQDAWSFLSKRFKFLPVLGSVHTSDLLNSYGGGELEDYIIRFVNNLDPNGGWSSRWPKYTTSTRKQLTFQDGLFPVVITTDDYRAEAMSFLTEVTLAHPI
ncbi:hypothetical protein AX17_006189 [Amanita inopinata Kibby_2008]|nr:hypothetical protein AX17_006189 [Amanita inopinata Kibby_2008]